MVCAFGQLLREPLLSELELLNVHPSLLPRWRGAAPIERAIMAGDERTGRLDHAGHRGARLGPGGARRGARGRRRRLSARSPRGSRGSARALLIAALDLRAAESWSSSPRTTSLATYAEKIEPADRRLDPARPAIELERRVRALTPHIGAYLELAGGERLGVEAARAEPGELAAGRAGRGGRAAGRLRRRASCACSGCARRRGRAMDADAYLRGHELAAAGVDA